MSSVTPCRCCLVRPPDKDLKSPYPWFGKSEIYADMIKECYEIKVLSETDGDNYGICETCILRLRDAYDFKLQVVRCQKEFQMQNVTKVPGEPMAKVKEELTDAEDDHGIYFFDELETFKEDEKLAEVLGLSEARITRSQRNKHGKKRAIMHGKAKDHKTKTKNPHKVSLHSVTRSEKLEKPVTSDDHELLTENMKYKINVQNIVKYSNCTPFFNKTVAGISCAYCKGSYPNLEELRKHTETHKKGEINDNKRLDKGSLSIKIDITDLKCSLCNAAMDVIANLKTHLIKEHDIKFYLDVFDYILEFKLTDGERLNCALCNSTFETFKMLLQHMNGHYRNYICDVCDMGFINKHRLKNHKRTHEVGTFKCEFCDKIFTTRVRKVCHEKYTHNTSARYTTNCPHCEKSFTSYYQRNRHMADEHNIAAATYKCNICDKSFILKSKLTSHIKKVHLMERNHTCAECGQGFFIKQSLDEHMVKHNGERVFKCNVCHKAYARKKTLREHMRIHNNDRRFKCGVCGMAFVQKCSMKSHMLSNHGISLSEFENARGVLTSP